MYDSNKWEWYNNYRQNFVNHEDFQNFEEWYDKNKEICKGFQTGKAFIINKHVLNLLQ